jgi:hypothetical protein
LRGQHVHSSSRPAKRRETVDEEVSPLSVLLFACSGLRVWGQQGRLNACQDAWQLALNVVVRHAQDADTTRPKDLVSRLIVPGLIQVYGPIDFHGKGSRMAVEIEDETIDDLLTAKTMSTRLSPTNSRPQDSLRRRHLGPKLPGSRQLLA